MRNTLAGYLYQALNQDPKPKLALRLQHAEGCTWKIDNEVLTLGLETGEQVGTIALSGMTLGGLLPAVEALGYSVADFNAAYASFGAETLMDGEGRQSQDNGDHLFIFDSLLWSLVAAYAKQVNNLGGGVKEALKQAYLNTAEQSWLDFWGESLGVSRKAGQLDGSYCAWIVREVTRPRANWHAIEAAILETTGDVVDITEPWQDMFILGESALSESGQFQDGSYCTYNVIRPVSAVPINWAEPLAIIDRDRPAGTLVLPPLFELGTQSLQHGVMAISAGIESARASWITRDCSGVLDDNLALSDSLPIVLNYPIFDGKFRWNNVGGGWDSRQWNMASAPSAEPETYQGNLDSELAMDVDLALSA